MRLSFRTRLSLWYTLAVALILALAGFGGHWALARTVLGQVDAALAALAEAEAAALQADTDQPVHVHEVAPGSSPPSFVRLDRFVQIIDQSGQVLATSANLGTARLPVPSEMVARLREGEIVFQTFDRFGEEPIRLVALPISVGGARYAVQVAGSLDDAYTLLNSARWLFLGLSVTVLAAAALTSVRFARRALRPIDQIVARARQIGESNLAERLPHPGSRDELGRLVDTLNEMLGRIERGLETQRRFTADASHELRSPLSRLRAELEVTLRRPRESAEYEETLRSCLEEVERLSHLTEDLLTLAHLDAEVDRRSGAAAVALSPILADALRRLEIAAARRAVKVVLQPGSESVEVRANAGAVGLALSNVLDNAVKFTPAGGQVTVGVRAAGAEALVLISDTGPGVSADELSGLFDRFHRGAAARASEAPGFGLGLAISRAAIEREGGSIRAETRRDGGATFSIHLPLAG
jgi:two-component system, OmpR family, sensor kinase